MNEVITVKENPRIPTRYLPIKDSNCHNLKSVSVDIPLNVLTVVTGVAGSGKSSLIRDVFAKEYAEDVLQQLVKSVKEIAIKKKYFLFNLMIKILWKYSICQQKKL